MSAPTGHKLDSNTIAIWRMGEPSASNVFKDAGPNGYDLAVTASPGVAAGQIDGCRSFNGSSQFGSRSLDAAIRTLLVGSTYSIEAWLNLDAAWAAAGTILYAGGDAFAADTAATNTLLQLSVAATRELGLFWESGTGTNNVITSVPVLSLSGWHHVAATHNGNAVAMYFDGLPVTTSGTPSAGPAGGTGTAQIRIGAPYQTSGTLTWFKGLIQEVRLSSSERSATEIRESYNRGRPAPTYAAVYNIAGSLEMADQKKNTSIVIPVCLFLPNSFDPATGIVYTDVSVTVLKADSTDETPTIGSGDWDDRGSGVYFLTLPSTCLSVEGNTLAIITATGCQRVTKEFTVVATKSADVYTRVGAPAGASIAADVAGVKTVADNVYSRQGAPAGASQSADVAALSTKLGTPAGASVSADVADIYAKASAIDGNVNVMGPQLDTIESNAFTAANNAGEAAANASAAFDAADLLSRFMRGDWVIESDTKQMVFYDRDDPEVELDRYELQNANGELTLSNPFRRVRVIVEEP